MLFNKKFAVSDSTDFIKCAAFSAITVPIISFIGAVIANSLSDPTAYIGTAALVSLILAAVISGAVTVRMTGGNVKVPLLAALFVTLIMMIIGLIINRGALPGGAAMNYICYFGIFALSSLLLKKRNGRKHKRSFKRR